MNLWLSLLGFVIIVLASQRIGQLFARFKLPLISGYLFTGILAGPFILDFIGTESIQHLRFLDDLSLAFIAFVAGNELNPKELKPHIKSITWHIAGQMLIIFILVVAAVMLMADTVPFLRELSTNAQLAAAILMGTILVARSPSSAIAVVNELRARGPFTRTILGVTITMDIVVVVFFAIGTAVADILLTSEVFNFTFVLLVVLELLASLLIGATLGYLIHLILTVHLNRFMKIALLLAVGYGAFDLAHILRDYSHEHLPFEILLEPLLICMIASFAVTNYSRYRAEFKALIEDIAPAIYVIFFTLVGDTLRLDVLAATFSITMLIFFMRLLGLFLGSLVGGTIAADPAQHNRLAWLAYITQAGIGLGLAREAVVEFPELGNEFATLVISIIVLNQLIGPLFLNYAIRRVGEANLPQTQRTDEIRDAVILGIDYQSLALARQLQAANWQITMVDTEDSYYEPPGFQQIRGHIIEKIDLPTISQLINLNTDAVIAMFQDDELNYAVCDLAYTFFSIPRIIVRLNERENTARFRELGAAIVDVDTAIVNLLEQYTRAPQTTALLLRDDPNYEITQITISNPDVDGLPLRDLRLPSDVLVLGIVREGHAVVPHGHSIVRSGDEITLIGHPDSLQGVTVHLGF